MTPEQIKNNRARFESLELSNGNPIHYDQINEGRYFCEYQQNRWIGYLMHAENMEVDISEPCTCLSYSEIVKAFDSWGIKIKSSGSE